MSKIKLCRRQGEVLFVAIVVAAGSKRQGDGRDEPNQVAGCVHGETSWTNEQGGNATATR
jgi:hypothetical protein